MRRQRLFALLLSLVLATTLGACDRDRTITTQPGSVVYAEGTVSEGIFYQFDNGVGTAGEKIAVAMHVPAAYGLVDPSTVKVEHIYNERTDAAMNNPDVEYARAPIPSALDNSDSTQSFWLPLPGSETLEYCDWIHYRWSFRYTRPESPNDEVVFIGQTRLIQLSDPVLWVDGDMYTRTDVCEAVP